MFYKTKVFLKLEEEGAETLEYVVIVAIILIIAAGVYNVSFKQAVQATFDTLNSADIAPKP